MLYLLFQWQQMWLLGNNFSIVTCLKTQLFPQMMSIFYVSSRINAVGSIMVNPYYTGLSCGRFMVKTTHPKQDENLSFVGIMNVYTTRVPSAWLELYGYILIDLAQSKTLKVTYKNMKFVRNIK